MRNFDIWNRYTDNKGNPLHGCVMFNVFGGNTPAPIYDSEGTAIDNPQLTDYYGRTGTQVFVDSDITAYFYKYIGTGIWNTELDIDVSDDTKWSLQYSVDSKEDVTASIVSDTAVCIPSIQALRTVDPDNIPEVNGIKVITLLGYNTVGDKEPINYVWKESSVATDNNGSVIQGERAQGRWIMVQPTEHCDSRHFGIFPANSLVTAVDKTSDFRNLVEYCNSVGIRPFLNAGIDYKYFKFTSSATVECPVIDMANSPIIDFYDGFTLKSEINGDFRCNTATLNLFANYAKASWNLKTLNKKNGLLPAAYVVNTSVYSTNVKTFAGWNIDFRANSSGYTLQQCHVTGNGILTDNTFNTCTFDVTGTVSTNNGFTNCVLNEYMFNGDQVQTATCVNCVVNAEDFRHKPYMFMCLNWLGGNYILDYQNIHAASGMFMNIALDTDTQIHNLICNGTNNFQESGNQHTYTFENVRGNIRLTNNATGNYYKFVNCQVNITNGYPNREMYFNFVNSDVVMDGAPNATVFCQGGTVTLNGSSYKQISLRDTTLSSTGTGITVDGMSAYSSSILVPVSSESTVYKDCQLNGQVTLRKRTLNEGIYRSAADIYGNVVSDTYYNIIDGYIDNCIVNGQIVLQPTGTNTLVFGLIITHNTANIQNPLVIPNNSNYWAEIDELHYYVISDNAGGFIKSDSASFYKSLTFADMPDYGTPAVAWPDDTPVLYSINQDYTTVCLYTDNIYDDVSGHDNGISGPIEYYRFGRDDFLVSVEWRINSHNISTMGIDDLIIPVMFTMKAHYIGNGKYKLNMRRAPNHQDSNRTSVTRIGMFLRSSSSSWAGFQLNTVMTASKEP